MTPLGGAREDAGLRCPRRRARRERRAVNGASGNSLNFDSPDTAKCYMSHTCRVCTVLSFTLANKRKENGASCPAHSVARRAQRVRRCDRCTRTPHRPRTRNPSSPLRCFPPWCPAGIPGAHVRLYHECDFFRVPFRSRAPPPTSTPPSSPPPRAFHCHVTAQS
jgi:hypothetical protein